MKLIKVSAGVLNQTPLDWSGNLQRIVGAIQAAREQQSSILCLPELCVTGYGCEDAFQSSDVQQRSFQQLAEIAHHCDQMVVSVGLPFHCAGGLFNGVALIVDGKVAGIVAKQHLAGDGLHYEPRWFKPWPGGEMLQLDLPIGRIPVGDIVFNLNGIRIGFEICEDAWVGSRPGANLAQRGVDMILNPSASHFAFGKHRIRRRFVIEGSRAFQVSYIYSNLLGNEAGRSIYDGDAMIASGGKLLALGDRFSFSDFCLTSALIDVQWTRMLRVRTASFRPQIANDRIGDEVDVPFDIPLARLSMARSAKTNQSDPATSPLTRLHNLEMDEPSEMPDSEVQAPGLNHSAGADLGLSTSGLSKEEEFTLAEALGLFDYLRKSRSRGFVISLSGGADSAAVAILCWYALQLAWRDLGPKEFGRKLGYLSESGWFREKEHVGPPAELLSSMIVTVYQATQNSGQVTRSAAATIAQLVGARHHVWDVDQIVKLYRETVEQTLGRELTWENDDITLQNIQARSRAPSVWMLANIHQALLLATSNRSEAAVGYATMDGDTSGGLSPIAGIDKHFLRQWLRWIETTGYGELGPLPQVQAINQQQPTAELRPPSEKQTDESDLMPYDLLDTVERLAIRDKLSPSEVLEHLGLQFPTYDSGQLKTWVTRFFTLWSRNQWKRERYAPSFHLDDENLDPKTWCRWPILNGGFRDELQDLD